MLFNKKRKNRCKYVGYPKSTDIEGNIYFIQVAVILPVSVPYYFLFLVLSDTYILILHYFFYFQADLCFETGKKNDIIVESKCAKSVPSSLMLLLLLGYWLFPSLFSISQLTMR